MNRPPELSMSKQEYFETLGYDWETVKPIIEHDKRYRDIQKSQTDTHHLIARVAGGADRIMNRKKVLREKHEAFHRFFGVQPPHEQIDHLIDFNNTVLTKDIKSSIRSMIARFDRKGDLYVDRAWI